MEQRVPAVQPVEWQGYLAAHLRRDGRRPRLRVSDHRFHHRAGPPTRQRRKKGADDQALGRSRGGLGTKIHLAVRGLGCPVAITLTGGQRGDAPQAGGLIAANPAAIVLADAAYDADAIRQQIDVAGAIAVIPNNPSRALKSPFDKTLYKERHLIECCIEKLKRYRRVATRYEKTARNFHSIVTIAAIVLWLR